MTELYDWSPLPSRQALRWPGDATLAVVVVVCLESVEWLPHDRVAPPAARGAVYPTAFDPTVLSMHEYGNRIGVFRVLDVLDQLHIRATAAVDRGIAARRSLLLEECAARGFAVAGRGVSASRMVTELETPESEADQIDGCLMAIERVIGCAPTGWFGAGYGESSRTLALLAERGLRYVCDWPNDDQPYRIHTPRGKLVSLPAALELDDEYVLRLRSLPAQSWREMVERAGSRLAAEGSASGRLLVLPLHPYLVGQPFRIRYLEAALEHLVSLSGTWFATADEVVDAWSEATP